MRPKGVAANDGVVLKVVLKVFISVVAGEVVDRGAHDNEPHPPLPGRNTSICASGMDLTLPRTCLVLHGWQGNA